MGTSLALEIDLEVCQGYLQNTDVEGRRGKINGGYLVKMTLVLATHYGRD